MRIGVHEVVHEDLLHVDPVEDARHLGPVDAGALQRRQVADLEIADVLQGQGAAGAPVPEAPGGCRPAASPAKSLGEALGVAPLGGEVELAAGGGGDLRGQAVEVDPAAQRRETLSSRRASPAAARSVSTSTSIPGRRTLTTTGSPPGSRAGWTWAREAAPTGSGEIQEKTSASGRPKSSSIWRDDVLEALRGDLVLQAGELAGDLRREEVDPHGEELAELDEDAAHLAGQGAVAAGDRAPSAPPPAGGTGAARAR